MRAGVQQQVHEPDDVLAAQAAAGDSAAFGELYQRHAGRILAFIRGRVSSQDEAEDLMQLVFLKAWQAMVRFRAGEAPFFAWLLVVASNTVISAHRKRRIALTTQLYEDGTGDRAVAGWEETVALRLDTEAWLRGALPQLRPLQRRVLLLRFAEGLDHAEVAARVGRTSAAVRVIQHRALLALRGMAPAQFTHPAAS